MSSSKRLTQLQQKILAKRSAAPVVAQHAGEVHSSIQAILEAQAEGDHKKANALRQQYLSSVGINKASSAAPAPVAAKAAVPVSPIDILAAAASRHQLRKAAMMQD